MRPVLTVSLPTTLPACAENQMSPFLSNTMVCGSRTAGSGIGYFLMLPSRGSSRPMKPARLPEDQTMPDLSTMRLCGPVLGSRSNFLNSPVSGTR